MLLKRTIEFWPSSSVLLQTIEAFFFLINDVYKRNRRANCDYSIKSCYLHDKVISQRKFILVHYDFIRNYAKLAILTIKAYTVDNKRN